MKRFFNHLALSTIIIIGPLIISCKKNEEIIPKKLSSDNKLASAPGSYWENRGGRCLDILNDGNTAIAIGTDNCTYIFNSSTLGWDKINNLKLYKIAGHSKKFIGIGLDNKIYEVITLTKTWKELPGNGRAIDLDVDNSGQIFVVGTDNNIYRFINNSWIKFNKGQLGATTIGVDGLVSNTTNENQVLRIYVNDKRNNNSLMVGAYDGNFINYPVAYYGITDIKAHLYNVAFTTQDFKIYYLFYGDNKSVYGKSFQKLDGAATSISLFFNVLWVIGTDTRAYYRK